MEEFGTEWTDTPRINHILIEAFCLKSICCEKYGNEPYPAFCSTKGKYATFQCMFNKCKFFDCTSCEDTLCYIGEESDEVYGVSFGGEMEEEPIDVGVDEWKEIAIAKVKEAYAEFMRKKTESSTC